ncbi:MAG TPA: translation initiation factor IF-2 [Chloroflexota bacterium]|nr:translation initiation factor IF-2 [Chloroflexota bacterium]
MPKKTRRPFPSRPQKPGARARAIQAAQDAIGARSTGLPEPKHGGDRSYALPPVVTVKEMSDLMGISAVDIIKALMKNGIMATINNQLDYETAAIVASDLGYDTVPQQEELDQASPDGATPSSIRRRNFIEGEAAEDLQSRPPVVTIMGHVDHGKTSLLDAIRQTRVAAGEAGGITQHIGAYQVEYQGQKITFIDTPGHEAFTAMRARGAMVTDIAIIVVAADDGVMPQTVEAINHAKAAGVPIIVAINKIDREEADPTRVKTQLMESGVVITEFGGEVEFAEVSAREKLGLDYLLDQILVVSEVQELKANPDRPAVGTIIEAEMDRNKGVIATVLVANGTLRVGDNIVVASTYGKVRALFDDRGHRIREAPPAFPASILGLTEVPAAGDHLQVVDDERTARTMGEKRAFAVKALQQATRGTSVEDLIASLGRTTTKELNIILKSDVRGSAEAVKASLERLSDEETRVKVIHDATGNVTESDLNLAIASKAMVVGFNVRADAAAQRMAVDEGVEMHFYSIIYNLIEDIEKKLQGMLEPKFAEQVDGHAEVRQVFKVGKSDVIFGCYVTDGQIVRNTSARVIRNGNLIFTGKINSLRRFKDDVRDVASGYECGIGLENFSDVKEGDVIETFSIVQV